MGTFVTIFPKQAENPPQPRQGDTGEVFGEGVHAVESACSRKVPLGAEVVLGI